MTFEEQNIKRLLESDFDIPFIVQKTVNGKEPSYWLSPENSNKELFSLKITIQNGIRLKAEFIPEKFSVAFIHSMGTQPLESRMLFADYITMIGKKNVKYTIRVNNEPLDIEHVADWPSQWNSFEARFNKMPIVEFSDDKPDYISIIKEWGSLLMGMLLSLTNIVSIEEEIPDSGFAEGTLRRVESNRYERNPLNRKLCLSAHGYLCKICGFDFEKIYGKIGYHFIHVHHIIPVSQLGNNYVIDPVKDLIPVCPNCHAILHRTNPPLSPEDLKRLIMNPIEK